MSTPKENITKYYENLVADHTARPELSNTAYSLDLQQDPVEYMEYVERWNADRIMILMMVLQHHLQDIHPDRYALLLVGSDARRENAPHSAFEFCIATDDKLVAEQVKNQILEHSCSNNAAFSEYPSHRIPTTDSIIEVKDLSKGTSRSYAVAGFNCNPEYVWPDRVLHAQLLWGNTEIFEQTKQRVIDELSNSSKLQTKLSRQGKQFLETTITGLSKRKGIPQKHFSLEDERLYFNPDEYILGLKYSVIRLVQNVLITSQFHCRSQFEDGNTLQILSDLFSHITTLYDDVVFSYSRSLQLYHLQQQLHHESNSVTDSIVSIGQQELLEILQPAIAFYNETAKLRK